MLVSGPEPVRLPTGGVAGWGLWPRFRDRADWHHGHGPQHSHGPDHGHGPHPGHDGPADEADADDGDDGDEPRHDLDRHAHPHRYGDEHERERAAFDAVRDRVEPGHVNRLA